MNLSTELSLVEAVLFLESEALDIKTISRITNLSKEVVTQVLDELNEKYSSADSGLEISRIADGYVLSPKKELWDYLRDRYGRKNENKLSKAALETLSIIAYSQPITKGEIENIRGVSADNMMRLLIHRNLIKSVGKKDVPGKPLQYGTTKDFLIYFNIPSIADLPKLDELNQEKFELDGR